MIDKLIRVAHNLRLRVRTKVRPLGLGVRLLVTCQEQVLLVRHSYQKGWYLPGGGVEPKETLPEAAARELWEECGVKGKSEPKFLGMFFSEQQGFSDHIALFHVEADFAAIRIDGMEIAEARFVPWDAYPDGTSPATLRRLDEFRANCPPPTRW